MRKFAAALSTAIGATLLAACAVGPDYLRPDMALDPVFAGAGDYVAASRPPAGAPAAPAFDDPAGYWRSFRDARLDALVQDTLVANHQLRIALHHLEAARALARESDFDRWPTVTATAQAANTRLGQEQVPGASLAERDSRAYSLDALASWELDLVSRVRRNVEAGHADAAAQAADLRALQLSLVAETVRDYVELRGLQERLQVAERNAATQAETLQLVQAGLDAGRGTDFDQARARAQWETTRSRVPALQAEIAFHMHRLAVLVGQPPDSLLETLARDALLPALPAPPAPDAPADLLRRRPDVAAAEQRLHASTARIGVATADLFPRLSLGALVGSESSLGGHLLSPGAGRRSGVLGIDWSFLDVGRVRARIAAADATSAADLAAYQLTVLRALEDGEDALVRYARARDEDLHLELAAHDSARAADLARKRSEAGAGTLLEILDAERVQLQAQDALAAARSRSLVSVVELYRAFAGGVPADLRGRGDAPAGTPAGASAAR